MTDSSLKIPKLARDGDYRTWSQLMRAYLITQDRLDKVLDTAPAQNDPAALEQDLLCRARLQLHVAGALQSLVARAKTAKEAWEALKEDYQGSLRTRQPQLTAQLTHLSQGGDSITAYVDKLLLLRDEFEALGMATSLPLLVAQFIRGLRDDLRMACAPTLHAIAQQKDSTIDDIATEVKTLSLILPGADLKGRTNTTGAGKDARPRRQPICWNCGTKGHTVRDCKKPKDEARIQRNRLKARGVKAADTFDTSANADNPGTVMTVSSATVANLRQHASALWLDSGATHHVVCDAGLLRSVRAPSVSSVVLGGGEEHRVSCEGDLLVTGGPRGSVLLTGVLSVPTLGINLLSTPQITSKHGSCWEGPHVANVYDPRGRVILRGRKVDGMYRVECALPLVSYARANVASSSANTWHRRFGHVGHGAMQQTLRARAVRGMEDVKLVAARQPCSVCDRAKLTRAVFARSSSRASYPTELVHSDTMGPMPIRGLDEELYVVTVLDDYSGYAETTLVRAKADAASALVDVLVRWQRRTGQKMKTLRTDQGTEFQGVLAGYCARKGIEHQTSVAYTPEQNGRAERLNRTLLERARALLLEHNLPKVLWSEAMKTAAYLRNRITQGSSSETPHELFYGEKPDVSHLRVYGCRAYAHIDKGQRDKLDAVSQECALVGYSTTSKAYRLLRPGLNDELSIVEAISVRFHEDVAPAFLADYHANEEAPPGVGGILVAPLDLQYNPGNSESSGSSSSEVTHDDEDGSDGGADEGYVEADAAPSNAEGEGTGGAAQGLEGVDVGEEASIAGSNAMGEHQAAPVPEPVAPVVPDLSALHIEQPEADIAGQEEAPMDAQDVQRRYPKRDRHPPTSWYRVGAPRINALDGLTDTPATYREAMGRPDKAQFQQAVSEELASLQAKGVYTEESPPTGVTPLPSKLVLTIKRDEHGNIDKYKARLVAKGFRQIAGRDFDEVFAPTAQNVTLRVLLATASSQGLEVDQLDVKTAFLNGELTEEVYIRLPVELGGRIWRLHKALYGLKQAARAWFAKLRSSMLAHGFTPSINEPCLFLRGDGDERVHIMVHVDDALVVGQRNAVNAAKKSMASMFEVKDMGAARHFLGITITRHDDNAFSLSQPKFVDDMLERFQLTNCKTAVTPMTVGQKLSKDIGKPLPPENLYQALVGSLLYLSVNTRPDISHAVGILSRFMSCPTDMHWEAAKHVLRYLKGAKHLGLRFTRNAPSNQGVFACELYTDADFAADIDKRRSTTGAVMLMQGAAVLWISKLQSVVATSTTEAEFIAAAMATKEGLWVRKLIGELSGQSRPLNLAVDNQAAVVLISEHTAGQSGRTKHIDVQFQFVRDRFQRGDVSVRFVPTSQQRADMFTKQLGGPEFRTHRSRVMGM